MSDPTLKWMIIVIFGGIGLFSLVTGSMWGYKRYVLHSTGVRVNGIVVENFKSVTTERDTNDQEVTSISYYPVVEFHTNKGESVRFHGSTGSSVPDFNVGNRVGVIYDPRDPSSAQIDDFNQMWLGPVALFVIGFITLAITTVVVVGMSKDDSSLRFAQKHLSFKARHGQSTHINGTIRKVMPLSGKETGNYVLVVSGLRPGEMKQDEFHSEPINFDPGLDLIGQKVTIHLDPNNRGIYQIDIAPLLPEIKARQNAIHSG